MVFPHTDAPTLLVVGSGIAGLMTAYQAARAGYTVTVLSKSPDPRLGAADTLYESATWDGFVNRFITLQEGHPYLRLPEVNGALHPGIDRDFTQEIHRGGMLVQPPEQYSALTQAFLVQREQANRDRDHIRQLFQDYTHENRASLALWYTLLTDTIATHPRLSERLSLHCQGVDRVYDDAQVWAAAVEFHQAQQILKHVATAAELRTQPDGRMYATGLEASGLVQGGSLTMYGLAFDVQCLGREWLLPSLERLGVRLCLGAAAEVVAIAREPDGRVRGLQTRNGQVYTAKHMSLQPGAYMAPSVLADTAAAGQLAGMKGLWLRIKNAQTLWGAPPRPVKIHTDRPWLSWEERAVQGQMCDLNAMPHLYPDGRWDLVIGSGYLFAGMYPFAGDRDPTPSAAGQRQSQLQQAETLVLTAIAQTVTQIYGLDINIAAVQAGRDPRVDIPAPGCFRSWSPDDRELRVLLPTTEGGAFLMEGGGNTGSATKAPFLAQVAVEFWRSLDRDRPAPADWSALYEQIRTQHQRTATDLTVAHWQQLETKLCSLVQQAHALV